MREKEFTLDLKGDVQSPARKFIRNMYEKYPQNPLNNREFGIIYGEGENMQVAFFELARSMRGPEWVEIRFVHTVPHRAGVGTRAMAEIQNMAQEAGVKLHLFAWDKGVVPQSKLRKFYTKTGFKQPKRNTFTWEPK
jgi:GNAT superfamily N-acetyltransferase